jgi:hypothetical protein
VSFFFFLPRSSIISRSIIQPTNPSSYRKAATAPFNESFLFLSL